MRHLGKLFECYRNGDRIEDDELEHLSQAMLELSWHCWQFGESFSLPALYAEKVSSDCREFLEARKKHARRLLGG